ncbi:hypothetical protein H0H93_011252 [Arthromyces matolae]|nr:hypothetical protein H0H93_011252 [Arthromyces matolae]
MRPQLLLLIVPPVVNAARFAHSLPDDTHAFPKSRVAFLNHLPLHPDTAAHWVTHGLRGGELQFLDQPWTDRLESTESVPQPSSLNYTLERMKLASKADYLCLIPTMDHPLHVESDDEPSDSEFVPSRSWSLLQPLSGNCLYHRQGWFTYSYCHNREIRQFKEATNSAGPHLPPQEDPEWESFTLGKAPQPGADISVADPNAQAVLELAQGPGSRYLVQKWSDGTLCDKTRRPREVEVQFHCSMTMTDNILFIKEAKTCSYVLVINTPRLCGEPGFKSHRDTSEEHQIRCRQVIDPQESDANTFSDVSDQLDHPSEIPRRKPVLPSAPAKDVPKVGAGGSTYSEILRKTLEALAAGKEGKVALQEVLADPDGVIFELVEDVDMTEDQLTGMDELEEALRAAGFDIRSIPIREKKEDDKMGEKGQAPAKNKKQGKRSPWHEEL